MSSDLACIGLVEQLNPRRVVGPGLDGFASEKCEADCHRKTDEKIPGHEHSPFSEYGTAVLKAGIKLRQKCEFCWRKRRNSRGVLSKII